MAVVVSIEYGVAVSQRALVLGCNARLPVHGREMREALVRVTSSCGASGMGWTSLGNREEGQRLVGMAVEQLISVERGGVSDAGAAVEMALWDLLGHMTHKPVAQLLAEACGSEEAPQEECDVYFTHLCFSDLGIADEQEACRVVAEEAREGARAGHTAFKMKVGRGALHMPPEEGMRRDVAVVKAVRAAVGPEARLMIDANNGYNVNLAKRVLLETRDCSVYWIEEAFHEDGELYARLKEWMAQEGLTTLIADGEGLASSMLVPWALEGRIDCVQYSAREKGFSFWLRLGRQLRKAGRHPAPHNFGSHFTCFAACHLAAVLRCPVEWDVALVSPMLDTSSYGPVTRGKVVLPRLPGFGIRLHSDLFAACPEYWRVA